MLRVLSEEDIREIHSASLSVLEHVGIAIHHDLALKSLEEAGAFVDHKKQLVKMPSDLIDEYVKKTPKSHTLAGRCLKNDLKIEPGKTYTRCASGAIYIVDSETGKCRETTSEDVKNFTKLQDALENISFCGGSPYPCDVHPKMRDISQIKTMLGNTEKHIRFQPLTGEGLSYIVKLAATVVGGEEELKKRPIVSCITAPSSPLRYSKEQTEIIIRSGKYGLPAMLGSTPIVGATGPVTLAGSLVLQNAEILGGIVLSQVMNPGAPLSYGPRMPIMDMKTGLCAWGAVEFGLTGAAAVQIGQLYGIETDLYGPASDSKVPDEQAAIERAFNALLPALAGANIINGAGVLESILSISMEQLVIDNEMLGMMLRALRGIEINEESLAMDVIGRVGPGGNFLGEKHTRKHFRTEHFIPQVFDRKVRKIWEEAGRKNIITTSKELVKEILREHETPPLDESTIKEMRSILEDAKKNIVGAK